MFFDVVFKILTALKGWVGHAPQGRGALHINNYRSDALHIIIMFWPSGRGALHINNYRSDALHIIIILNERLLLAKYYFIFRLKFIV